MEATYQVKHALGRISACDLLGSVRTRRALVRAAAQVEHCSCRLRAAAAGVRVPRRMGRDRDST
eukprot:6193847-Pleurochrysis_carterae.AAC.2